MLKVKIKEYFQKLQFEEIKSNSCLKIYAENHNFNNKPRRWINSEEDKILSFFQSGALNYIKKSAIHVTLK